MPNESLHTILSKYWELCSSKLPKGFGKYFGDEKEPKKPDGPSDKKKPDESRSPIEGMDKDFKDLEKKIEQLFFKERTKSSDGGGKGGSTSNDNGAYYKGGFLAATVIAAGFMYYANYAQTEISWKEFVRYVKRPNHFHISHLIR